MKSANLSTILNLMRRRKNDKERSNKSELTEVNTAMTSINFRRLFVKKLGTKVSQNLQDKVIIKLLKNSTNIVEMAQSFLDDLLTYFLN